MAGSHLNCWTYIKCYFTIWRTYIRFVIVIYRNGGESNDDDKAYKFRIYPNQAQAILINKTIGCSRFVFNHFLSLWDHAYKETGKGLTYGTCSAKLPAMKKELVWLKEVDSIAIQSSIRNLADAYTRFSKQNSAPDLNLRKQRTILHHKTNK